MRRDARSGELRLLALALVLAVAAMSAVGFFTDRVRQALIQEAGQLLGADLVLAADHPWPEPARAEARRLGLQESLTLSFPSMVIGSQGFQMVDAKAVDGAYPLRGQLRLAGAPHLPGEPARGAPPAGSVWIEPRLGADLGVVPGDSLQLGERRLRVDAYLTLEPDRSANFIGVAPRLMFNLEDLQSTGLIQVGARVSYRLLLAGGREQVNDFSAWLKTRLGRGEKLEEGSRQEMRSALERAQRFLGLASLLTVILAAVAMALAVRRYIHRHLDPCALLRCLGASRAEVLQLYLGQFLILGLLACAAGMVLGFLAHFGLYAFLARLLDTRLPLPGLLPALQGMAAGFVLLLGFALPPLVRLHRVTPLRVLRRDLGLPPPSLLAAYGLGLAALAGLIFWVANDPRLGGLAVLAFLAALFAFGVLARAGLWCLARLRHWGGTGGRLGWRYGLASLERHAWSVSLQVLALALGFTALLLLTVIRGELLSAWQQSVPPDAPNRFVINIQPDQTGAVAEALAQAGWAADLAPMVRGRLTRINGEAVRAERYGEDERAQRLVEREFNLSWTADLPGGNRVEAGRWFGPEERGQGVASVESGLAKTLGLGLGDQLEFTVAGQPVTVRITSLRALNWDSMRVNFFVLMPPGVLDGMPASYLTSFHLPPGQESRLTGVLQRFPNLTLIDVAAILAQLRGVIDQVAGAVQFVFLFTLLAGLLVLQGALAAAFDERRQSIAIMRALGAGRAQLRAGLLTELMVIGALAGGLGGIGALLIGQVLALRLFDLVLVPALWILPCAVLAGAAITAAAGSVSLRKLLASHPMDALRALA